MATTSEEAPPRRPASAGVLEKLAAHIQQQKDRQRKRIQNMERYHAARLAAASQLKRKEQQEVQRQQELEALRQEQQELAQRRLALAEERRRDRLAAAQQQERSRRCHAMSRLEQGAERAQRLAAEREEAAVMQRVKSTVEAQKRAEAVRLRAELERRDKAAWVEQRQARHESVLERAAADRAAVEAARRADEERREAARQLALARAEAELSEKVTFYRKRQQQKEEELEQHSRDLADLRTMKQHERQMRAAYARHRTKLAAQREEERRAELAANLAAKQRRVAELEHEKAVMLRALQVVRKDIMLQEQRLKEALALMDKGDASLEAELALLQRQLDDLTIRPAPASSRGSSRQDSRPVSRAGGSTSAAAAAAHRPATAPVAARPPVSAAAVAAATLELRPAQRSASAASASSKEETSSGRALQAQHNAVQGHRSPRIAAVYAPQPAAAEAGGRVTCSLPVDSSSSGSGGSVSQEVEPRSSTFYAAQAHGMHTGTQVQQLQPGAARQKLQQLLEMELAREAEREALLGTVQDKGDRQRLIRVFEVERQSALTLMTQLQRQLQQ